MRNLFFLLMLCMSTVFSSHTLALSKNITASLQSTNTVRIEKDKSITDLKMGFDIFGYSISCSGEYIVIWGKDFNPDHPQDSMYSIYKTSSFKLVRSQGVDSNIYEPLFLKGSRLYIDSGDGLIVNLMDATEQAVDNEMMLSLDSLLEHCQKPGGWSFTKYTKDQ